MQARRNNHQPILISTAFELDNDQRAEIQTAIEACLGVGQELRFAQTPNLLCGIELKTGGHKIAWSVGETLAELEEHLVKSLEAALAVPAPQEEPMPEESTP